VTSAVGAISPRARGAGPLAHRRDLRRGGDGGRVCRRAARGASKARNPQLSAPTTRAEFIALREARDAQLAAPHLLLPSVQVNVDAGKLPAPHANGNRYLVVPLNVLRPADELGRPKGGR
jgi:hypothetical protein